MIWTLFVAHLVGIVAAGLAGRASMRAGLLTASVAPALTATWAAGLLITTDSTPAVDLVWVAGLDLSITFRLDGLALLMTGLVSGIGALVFVYATGYFAAEAPGGTRFPPTLLAFSTSMLGLVWADSIWTFFIFWELTSITSFLLVGHKNSDAAVRTAARRALLITGSGGLALLAGLLILGREANTAVLSEIGPVGGTPATVAAVLILLGAATKSAQVPFHVWLPGAMAAPTPVSAYLHSATMVKAGVLLVAVAGPAFANVAAWKTVGVLFGATSIVWGAVGALRHRDAKLILAWGTISQLGLLVTLLAVGTGKAVFAAISILFAHALFKAALFLVVGEIDIRTGTRDIAELGGLARTMPVAFIIATTAGLSMAGVPPLVGFAAKEAAVEAAIGLTGTERLVISAVIIGGAVLTVAYTLRFLMAVFGPGQQTAVAPGRPAMTVPAGLLALAGLAGFAALGSVNAMVGPAATELNAKADVYRLLRWPGLTMAFSISIVIIVVGGLLGFVLARRPVADAPSSLGADLADRAIDGVLALAPRVTARVQHGSLPVYLTTMAAVVILASTPFALALDLSYLKPWDTPLQAVLAAIVVVSAAAGAFVGSRLGAALTLGAVGTGVSGLFIVHGAPDLALTQLLVETVVVVGFVLGLGHLGRRFPPIDNSWRAVRLILAAAGGTAVTVALAAAGSGSSGRSPVDELTSGAVAEGGGKNVVNVILTDIRALDTLGEVVVLATVAVGIGALATTNRSRPA